MSTADGLVWRTSSFSGDGESCVEVAWRTSSFSGDGENCVEVAPAVGSVLVRDTKCREAGAISFSRLAWSELVTALA